MQAPPRRNWRQMERQCSQMESQRSQLERLGSNLNAGGEQVEPNGAPAGSNVALANQNRALAEPNGALAERNQRQGFKSSGRHDLSKTSIIDGLLLENPGPKAPGHFEVSSRSSWTGRNFPEREADFPASWGVAGARKRQEPGQDHCRGQK